LDPARLRAWIERHRLLVLRGFDPMPGDAFVDFCRRWPRASTVDWSFGALLELEERADAANYLFSAEHVPYHWDGAFHRVPHVLCFHCVEACDSPGGETLFASGELLWDAASEADRDEWAKIELEYATEKVAHYGGRFRAPLLDEHPAHGTTVVRFAEAVRTEKNPVSLAVHGVDAATAGFHVERLTDRLYDPAFRYAHRWRAGDYVFADNLALLHARTPFRSGDRRRLRRVQLRFDDWRTP
jgi:alpha-ketoglutarate-dependent taurine dioxygenase